MSKSIPAAEQFAALGIPTTEWTTAMRLAVSQRWSNLEVDAKVADLRARIAAVKPADVDDVETIAADAVAAHAFSDEATAKVWATAERKRLKRNAAVQAWRERNQLQAALDAREAKFARMRAGKTSAQPAALPTEVAV